MDASTMKGIERSDSRYWMTDRRTRLIEQYVGALLSNGQHEYNIWTPEDTTKIAEIFADAVIALAAPKATPLTEPDPQG